MFGKLETPSMAQSLGVKNFGISMTTLEEVFLKLGKYSDLHSVYMYFVSDIPCNNCTLFKAL